MPRHAQVIIAAKKHNLTALPNRAHRPGRLQGFDLAVKALFFEKIQFIVKHGSIRHFLVFLNFSERHDGHMTAETH